MKTIDKILFTVLILLAIFILYFGFSSITGNAIITLSSIAVGIGSLGFKVWLGILGVLIVAFVFVRASGKR